MDRANLIILSIVLYTFLLIAFPLQTITISSVIVGSYFAITRMKNTSVNDNGAEYRRMNALRTARIYLSPYINIWNNLKLSNKFCELTLDESGEIIRGKDKTGSKASFRILYSTVHLETELWNLFCINFSYNTTYDGLKELCDKFQADYAEDVPIMPKNTESEKIVLPNIESKVEHKEARSEEDKEEIKIEKLDVNNASEVEITALPGVSIVLAKKLIKRRDEINGFKSVDDVCTFLKLKPHMESQLRNLICVNKMRGSLKIKKNIERSVDI